MKQINLLLWGAAVLTLTACSNNTLLNDIQDETEPQAIAFASFSEKSTRGDVNNSANLEYYHNSFKVYATKKNPVDVQTPFAGVDCNYQITSDATLGDWKYDIPRFWDKQATYKFIAFAPANAPLVYTFDDGNEENGKEEVGVASANFTTTSAVILKGQNLQTTPTTAEKVKGFVGGEGDTDLMTSEVVTEDGAAHHADVPLVFKHILAKLNVAIKKGHDVDANGTEYLGDTKVTITKVEIKNLKDKGSYSENAYNLALAPGTSTSGWTSSFDIEEEASRTYKLKNTTSTNLLETKNSGVYNKLYFIESLVMPQEIDESATITIAYTFTTGTGEAALVENFVYTKDLDEIFTENLLDRNCYNLTFTIQPDVITFDAGVTEWVDIDYEENVSEQPENPLP